VYKPLRQWQLHIFRTTTSLVGKMIAVYTPILNNKKIIIIITATTIYLALLHYHGKAIKGAQGAASIRVHERFIRAYAVVPAICTLYYKHETDFFRHMTARCSSVLD